LQDDRWINVGSFHGPIIEHFRKHAPNVSTAASLAEVADLYFNRFISTKKKTAPNNKILGKVLQIPPRWYGLPLHTKHFIETIERSKLSVVYWTINNTTKMQKLLQRGAHGIVSDEIDVARKTIDAFIESKK